MKFLMMTTKLKWRCFALERLSLTQQQYNEILSTYMNICQILCGIIFWYIKFFTFNPNAQKAKNNLRCSIVPLIGMKNEIAWIINFSFTTLNKNPTFKYHWCSKNQKCRLHLLIKTRSARKILKAVDYYDLN